MNIINYRKSKNIKTHEKIVKVKDLAIHLSSYKIRREELRKLIKVLIKLELVEPTYRPGFLKVKDERILKLFKNYDQR